MSANNGIDQARTRARRFAQLRLHLVVVNCCGREMRVSRREETQVLAKVGEYNQVGEYRACSLCKREVLLMPQEAGGKVLPGRTHP